MLFVVLVLVGSLAFFLFSGDRLSPGANSDVPTATAKITTLIDKVTEQGDLESQSTIIGKCEIDHYENNLIFLAPEGSKVKKDDVVAKFDASNFTTMVNERETRVTEQQQEVETAKQELKVQQDENSINLRKAKQTLSFAELDLKKYTEGDHKVALSDLEGSISEARTQVDKAKRDRDNIRVLVRKGFREYEQLREADQVVRSANLRLTNAIQKLDTLKNFDHPKQLTTYEDKVAEAKHGLKIAETTAEAKLAKAKDRLKSEERGLVLQNKRLKELQKNLDRHVMKAPQDGTLTYALNRWTGQGEKVRPGIRIHQNQEVFILPDMSRMQVKVGIHETLVSKVKAGQRAVIRVDAFAGSSLTGKVKSVSALSASTPWERSKNYHVTVTIDSFPNDMKIRPGMTAEVEIKVGEYRDVLAIPVQAVTSFGRRKFVFRQSSGKFEPVEVKIGRSNLSFVEIVEGLEEEDVVALDAYQRGLTEFADRDAEEEEAAEEFDSNNNENEDSNPGKANNASEPDDQPELDVSAGQTVGQQLAPDSKQDEVGKTSADLPPEEDKSAPSADKETDPKLEPETPEPSKEGAATKS